MRNSGATAVVEGVGDHGCEYMTGGRVIVLGPTGRNFAAGMSGGIAYVYDPHAVFGAKVNYELVDLEALSAEDLDFVRSTIEKHVTETDSAIGSKIVNGWTTEQSNFRKVMPRDYKRVLAVLDDAKAHGLSEQEAVDKVMEVARG